MANIDKVQFMNMVLLTLFREFLNIDDLPLNFSPWWKNKMAVTVVFFQYLWNKHQFYFSIFNVCCQQIQNALQEVQLSVVTGDEKLKDAMVPISTLHLTIMVMHLATEEDEER